MGALVNRIGIKYGRLTPIQYLGRSLWRCKCKCGKHTKARSCDLTEGHKKSCGCLLQDHYVRSHQMAGTVEYRAWYNMLQRCYNRKNQHYHNYGKRGIKVCKRWYHSFEKFLEDMGSRPAGQNGGRSKYSIEREDNDKSYNRHNCKWKTQKEQMRNTRDTRQLTYNGETKSIIEWAEQSGIRYNIIRQRVDRGWSAKRAIFTTYVSRQIPPARS